MISNDISAQAGREHRIAGGAATGGGINFQATTTAIAFSYLLRGRPLKWLEGLHDDIPVSVAAETGRAGDDIQLHLRGEKICEVQVKKGLQADKRLWSPLIDMGRAIANGKTDFAVLAVSSNSSQTIREELATAIIRIGEGRTDNLPEIGTKFLHKLKTEELDPRIICRALRIVTISATSNDRSAIGAAQAELGHVCRNDDQIMAAWTSLYHDAMTLIERRGRRDLSLLVQLLRSIGVLLDNDHGSPAALLDRLLEWTIRTNATFTIFGVSKPLPFDKAWIPLQAIIRDDANHPTDLRTAIIAYQSWHDREYSRDGRIVDPEALGRFIKLVVLVAGPGMGKTTLLSRIAICYATDGIPVIRVRLSMVAARMQLGYTFEEAVFALGLDGSGISTRDAILADLRNWVLLCDGLDEIGPKNQSDIAAAASRFAEGHPDSRVVVTTRPVGYHAGNLGHWRHYDIMPLERSSAPDYLARLLRAIGDEDSDLHRDANSIATIAFQEDSTAKAISRSPLLLTLSASVIARDGSLSTSRSGLYERLFASVDDAPNSRNPEPPDAPIILRRFLGILAWQIVADPIASVSDTLSRCAEALVVEIGLKSLEAQKSAEIFLRYWQEVGLVERIRHDDTETLVFIHKTFGEFAAGRHLADLPPTKRTAELSIIGADDAWSEVLSFSALLGMADDVCAHLVAVAGPDAAGVAKITRCLKIYREAQIRPNDANRTRIIDLAFDIACSPRQQWAIEVGLALVPTARRYPAEIAPRFKPLIADPQSWTRLIGWAVLVSAGPPFLDLDQLRAVIVSEASQKESRIWSSQRASHIFMRKSERDIAQLFVLEAAQQLLEHRPGKATDDALFSIFRHEDLATIEFLDRATHLLKKFDKTHNLYEGLIDLPYYSFLEALFQAYMTLFNAIDPSGAISAPPAKKLLNLSAFLRLCDFLDAPADDGWSWTYPFDPEMVHAVVQAAIAASGLPPEQLVKEVQAARSLLANKENFSSLWQSTSEVDITPMDWEAAAFTEPSLVKIEAALNHRSYWLAHLAANILNGITDDKTKHAIALRTIQHGQGISLSVATELATGLRNSDVLKAIYSRLSKNLSPGCEYLIEALPKLGASLNQQLLHALEAGFLRGTLETAMSAAKVAMHFAAPDYIELLPVLERAAEYWLLREEPYPVNGGVVPESPRELIARAHAAISAPDYDQLKAYISDSRWDVRQIGVTMLTTRVCKQAALAATFLTDIEEERLAADILDKVLTEGVAWEDAALTRVEDFLFSSRIDLCFAAMSLLCTAYRSTEAIQEQATKLTNHTDGQIREKAFRILDAVSKMPLSPF